MQYRRLYYVSARFWKGRLDSPCCANWALRNTSIDSELDIKNTIERNFYMDDFLKSLSNVDDLINLSKRVMSVLQCHGFRLTKWMSNSPEILHSLPTSEISTNTISLDLNTPTVERALGMIWNINQDTLIFKPITREYPNTKRGILSLVSSVFDPLGILTPSLQEPKLIIQELWKLKIDWDSKIPLEIETRWIKWKSGLHKISQISLNRWYGFQHIDKMKVELNIFCDASAQAYGAIAYFVFSVNHIRKNCKSDIL